MQRNQCISLLLQNLETCAYISKFRLDFCAVDYGVMQCSYIAAKKVVFGVQRLDLILNMMIISMVMVK